MEGELDSLHPLLARQLRRTDAAVDRPPDLAGWQELLRRVSRSYRAAEDDRYTLERAMEVSSGELHDLNRALLAERDKLHAVVSDGLCLIDSEGVVQSVNREAARLLGVRAAAMVGSRLLGRVRVEVETSGSSRSANPAIEAMLAAGEAWTEERAVLVHASGFRIPVSLALNPVQVGQTVVGSMVALRDRSQQRDAERRLLHANEELQRARDHAWSANEAKSRFLATMSHEIRTPMHGVLGTLALLLESSLDSQQFELAATASRSAERLLAILNDVLDFSKIEAGKLSLEELEFELRPEVEASVALYSESKQVGVDLCCFVADDVPDFVVGDSLRLRQVLTNLVGNAVKFTSQGQIVVRVERVPAAGRVRFSVEDSGAGMSETVQQSIFEAFTQADGSTTRRYGGTGLGLAICRDLTALMGGELRVHSQEGVGTTFWFDLELAAGAQNAASFDSLEGLRVLVVDDIAVNRQILDDYLRAWNCTVVGAAGATEAEAALARSVFDVALIDFMMPEVNGVELARRIRADARSKSMALVMLSSANTDREAARRVGITTLLSKPISQRALHDALRTVTGLAGTVERVTPQSADVRFTGRVLLVEDNQVNQRVAAAILQKLGLEVDIAADGADGVMQSARVDYDLILMDCHMPNLDGFEATRRIRSRESHSGGRVPVVAMTASAMVEDRRRCLEAGMDDHLPKPATKAAIAEVIGRWLRREDGGE